MPKLCSRLIDIASRCLPKDLAERYASEWQDHLYNEKTTLGMMLHALGCFTAVPGLIVNEFRRIVRARDDLVLDIVQTQMKIAATADSIRSLAIKFPSEKTKNMLEKAADNTGAYKDSLTPIIKLVNDVAISDLLCLVHLRKDTPKDLKRRVAEFSERSKRIRLS